MLAHAGALEKLFDARDANARVGIACSGGADSVFLLLCTAQILGKNKKNLRVLHFNHKARGNAEKDEAFVRGLAEKLGIEFVAGRPEKGPEKMSEDVFRKMRMEFFERCSREMHLDCIAQGHHADDVAETTLMRLMRGSGLDGMCAPRAVSAHPCATFVRPLLELKKAAITAMLEKLGMGWREDETNAQTHFLRNRVRNVIIPEIEKACAGSFSNSAGRTRALLQEDSDALRKKLRPVYVQLKGWAQDISNVRKFADLPEEAKRYVAFCMKSIIDVAAKDSGLKKLPNLRYIGVGPMQSQIIRDIPTTEDLLKLV